MAAAVVVLAIQPAVATAETISVNNGTFAIDHSMCGVPGEVPCVTIQYAASSRAQSGDTVLVSPGNYIEQVDVTKALTIRGAGRGLTTISAPAQASLVSHGLAGEYPVVTGRTAGPLTIKDLTIDGRQQGYTSGGCAKNFDGVHLHGVSGTIENVRITGVRAATNPQSDCGQPILAFNGTATPVAWHVTNTQVDDGSPYGSALQQASSTAGSTATLTDSTFTGPASPSPANAPPLGVALSGLTATVRGNTFERFACVSAPPACGSNPYVGSSGLGLQLAALRGASTVTNNRFNDNGGGMLELSSPNAPLEVSNNTFTNNRVYGFVPSSADGTVTGNRFEGGGTGLFLASTTPSNPPDVALRGNTITGAQRGIYVSRSNASVPSPTGSGAGNRIVGNTAGVVNETPETFTVENNWWGCNDGPGQPGCDTVTGPVDADPRLVLGLTADPTALPPGGATSSLTASVLANSNGEIAGGAFPDGVPVGFATDLGTIGAQPTTVGGLAASTLTSGDTDGDANVSATLDGQTVTTPVTIGTPSPPAAEPCTNAIKGKKKGDKLVGTAEGDVINGKAGNDKITGGGGEDCLKGGPGNDKFKSRDDEVDRVNCGPGTDRVKADKIDVIKKNCEKVKVK